AERAQALERLRVLRHWLYAAVARAQLAEPPAQPLQVLRARGGQVPELAGVGVEVVELGQGQLDVLEGAVAQPVERRPAAVDRGRERLEVAGARRVLAAPGD